MAESGPTQPRVWLTAPNTPERMEEIDRWMVRQNQAAVDKLHLTLRESADEARIYREGIELIQEAFKDADD